MKPKVRRSWEEGKMGAIERTSAIEPDSAVERDSVRCFLTGILKKLHPERLAGIYKDEIFF